MAEPVSSTGLTALTVTGVGLAAMLPWLDVNALIGAISGAAIVAAHRKDIGALSRIVGMFMSTAAGYVCAPELVLQTPLNQTGPAAVVGAVVILPVLLRVLAYIEKMDVADWLRKRMGG